MREIKKNEADVFEAVYHQLEEMDFSISSKTVEDVLFM